MSAQKINNLFRKFKELKKNKENIPTEQYLKEIVLIKIELESHLENPTIEKNEMSQLESLIKSINN
ncbi:hypothetical protein [Abyssalbus ytuae]|uniref:Uncharacterized protein n=1 Tax=Abyssalbus ytuae TaxID=2926907 RepID=A0A9E7D2E7_9FLAO|nr:hypothetical protein [Abyssalbus ytuae]UOB16614.1 hypothetical protein MQE35_12815 [Abyssalbus ytuae]